MVGGPFTVRSSLFPSIGGEENEFNIHFNSYGLTASFGTQIKLHRVVIRCQSVWWRRISPRTAGKNSAVDMNHGEGCQGKDHRGIFESEREARG